VNVGDSNDDSADDDNDDVDGEGDDAFSTAQLLFILTPSF